MPPRLDVNNPGTLPLSVPDGSRPQSAADFARYSHWDPALI